MNRPALATASTVLGLLLLLGGKAATSNGVGTLTAGSVALPPTASGTVLGPVISTRYGPVQVQVVAAGGKVTDVQAVQHPSGGQSGSIADYSIPILRKEAIAAQSAGIQAVSGATYTSQGYASSLQAALDELAANKPASATTLANGSTTGPATR